jgi:hypothetical protein
MICSQIYDIYIYDTIFHWNSTLPLWNICFAKLLSNQPEMMSLNIISHANQITLCYYDLLSLLCIIT